VLRQRLDRLQAGARKAGFERHVHRLRMLQTQAALLWLAEFEADQEPRSPGGAGAPERAAHLGSPWPALALGANDFPEGASTPPTGEGTMDR
jgi:hypothetical protein